MNRIEISNDTAPETATKILRLIVAALSTGLVLTTVVFAFVTSDATADPKTGQILLVVAALLGAGSFAGWTVFRRIDFASQRRKWADELASGEPPRLVQSFFHQHLVGAALSEAAGLTAAVAFFVGGSVLALIGVLVALYALSRFYPRDDGYERFVQSVAGTGTSP